MRPPPPRRRPARAVGDARIEGLAGRGVDLARGWLIALVEQAPLDEVESIVGGGGDFGRLAPRLCEALVRALMHDADLRRIEAGGALEPLVSRAGELVGARDAAAVARSVDALQAVIWSAVRAGLGGDDADFVAAVAERLALVGELARGAALRAVAEGGWKRNASPAFRWKRSASPAFQRQQGPRAQPRRGWNDGGQPGEHLARALEEEIARCERTGAAVSLLVVELEDIDRLVAASPAGEAAGMFDRFARAVSEVARREDILVRESEGRVWVIARELERPGTSTLASRIQAIVRALPTWGGAPMAVSIGVAVLGEDGRDAGELIEAAEVAKFAAQASGIEISRARPGDETPPAGGPQIVS